MNLEYLDFSDPQNRGQRWCWKLRFKAITPHNFGYLVHHAECLKNRYSPFFQETSDASVCTKEGGIEIDYLPFEGSTVPYKIACISRLDAMSADFVKFERESTKGALREDDIIHL